MLKRREKRRYISIAHGCSTADALAAIERHMQDLFGTIALERASLKVVRPGEGVSVLRCKLGSEEKVLVAVALASQPLATLDMSSSMKRLKRRLAAKVNTALMAEKTRG